MNITRDQVKEAVSQLHTSTPGSPQWLKAYAVMVDYFDQPVENPDAEVWAEIDSLIEQLFAVTGETWKVDCGATTREWGVCKLDMQYEPPRFLRVFGCSYTATGIHDTLADKLKELTPKPTLESEGAARKQAEKMLEDSRASRMGLEAENKQLNQALTSVQERCKSEVDNLMAVNRKQEERIAELEGPQWTRVFSDQEDHLYQVRTVDGVVGIYHKTGSSVAEWDLSNDIDRERVYDGISDANAVLAAFALLHGLSKVKP